MSEVKWIKLNVDIFNDEKIEAIGTLPDGNIIQLVWLKLLCLAGKCNEGGLLMVTREMPYTDEMMAKRFDLDIAIVQRSLAVFQKLEMIDVVENIYLVSNWSKYQNTESLEELKEKHRERQRRYVERKKQKLLGQANDDCDVTNDVTNDVKMTGKCSSSITLNSNNSLLSNSKDINSSSNSINTLKDNNNPVKSIIDSWNTLSDIGIKPIRSMSAGSKRNELLKARIREHGVDTIIEAIENIRESDFLQGRNDRGWMVTFDWFLLPSNFQKVLEGNYDRRNRPVGPPSRNAEKIQALENWGKRFE